MVSRFVESGVLLDADEAADVFALMVETLKKLTRNGVVLRGRTAEMVQALTRAAEHRAFAVAKAKAVEVVGDVTVSGVDEIGSAEAARLLGVSPQRVGQLVAIGKLEGAR